VGSSMSLRRAAVRVRWRFLGLADLVISSLPTGRPHGRLLYIEKLSFIKMTLPSRRKLPAGPDASTTAF
jgi:hypothetical protein